MIRLRNIFRTLAKILAVYTLVVFSGLVLKSCPGCSADAETMEVKVCCGSDTGSCTADCSSDISLVIKADADLIPVVESAEYAYGLNPIAVAVVSNLNVQSNFISRAAFLAPLYFPEPDLRVLYQVFRC